MRKHILYRRNAASETFAWTVVGLGSLCLVSSTNAQTPAPRFAIEASQVTAAMLEGSLPVDGVQVKLAAPVTSSVFVAKIEVQSALLIASNQARLKLACLDRSACLPFFALVTYPEVVNRSTFHLGREAKPSDVRQPDAQHHSVDETRTEKPTDLKDAGTLHAGAKAMLEIEADRIHVRIEVISLQSGAPGSRVRVTSIDHKQIYTAEVLTPNLLKGELLK